MFITVKIKKYLTGLLILCVSNVIFAQNQKLFKYEHFINQTDTLNYRILLPKHFDETKQYPLVLFLHGGGERGSDNAKQLVNGSSLFAKRKHRRKFPAIVIFPQCPQNDYWARATIDRNTNPYAIDFPLDSIPTKSLSLVMQLMDEMASKPFVKSDQIYVGGLSMGGMGTFEILYRKPKMFAAAFAICGGGNVETVSQYATSTPIWVFHGANDDIVDPQLSIAMVGANLKAGGKPNFNLYSNDNHNSWDSAFSEPSLLAWLFSKSKQKQ
jgi:predicted peptidase